MIYLSDPVTGWDRGRLEGHTYEVLALAFSPDGYLLASVGNDGVIRLWDVASARVTSALVAGRLSKALAYSVAGLAVAVDTSVMVFDVRTAP